MFQIQAQGAPAARQQILALRAGQTASLSLVEVARGKNTTDQHPTCECQDHSNQSAGRAPKKPSIVERSFSAVSACEDFSAHSGRL
jgi:hypothetical protein